MCGEAKKDCFAYQERLNGEGNCRALDRLYCADKEEKKECPFYKKRKGSLFNESED